MGHAAIGILALTFGPRTSRFQISAQQANSEHLFTRQASPFNAEPPLSRLIENWITPVDSFFVRSHGDIPSLDAKDLTLSIEGLVETPLTFTLDDLIKRFPAAKTTATLTCAGNRRAEFSAIKKVGGVQWDAGAIGNAEWQGVRLVDVLKLAGVKGEAKHVWFDGRDQVTEKNVTFPFGGSISIEKALNATATGATLLATRMNGQPLTPAHGHPLRNIVPGYIGARSVKWLHKITLADRPSPNHFVADVYKIVPEENADLIAKTSPIYEFLLNSAICSPKSGSAVTGDRVTVRGFALTNGTPGRTVEKIEVSADDGRTWTRAKVNSPTSDFCWVLWSADVPVMKSTESLTVRATDSSGDIQPRQCPWNFKGYQFNGWHTVKLNRS